MASQDLVLAKVKEKNASAVLTNGYIQLTTTVPFLDCKLSCNLKLHTVRDAERFCEE